MRFVHNLPFLLVPVFASALWPATIYTAIDLGTLGGSTTALGMNGLGQVVGYSAGHAFLYSNGVMKDLGTLGGISSQAYGINDAGIIGGNSFTAQGYVNAFLYTSGALGNLGFSGSINSINNSGTAVGTLNGPAGFSAFQYSGGVMTDLGTFGGTDSTANGINSTGQIAGRLTLRGPNVTVFQAYIYSGGTVTELGTLGGRSSDARAINDSGQVAGSSDTANGSQHAFLYSQGVMKDLGAIGGSGGLSYASAINNAGQVVGYDLGIFNGSTDYHAFLYSGGVMTDLNSLVALNAVLQFANGINDRGQIIAQASNSHAYLLTPLAAATTATPEPATSVVSAVGLIGMIFSRKRRQSE